MADRYWIGGTGNWSDTSHWSATSGGAGGATKPTSADAVYFDANSFTGAGQVVTMNANGSFASMDWTGATNTPDLAGTSERYLNAYGNITFISDMTVSFAGTLQTIQDTTAILVAPCSCAFGLKIVGGNTFTFGSNFTTTGDIWLVTVDDTITINTGNYNITCDSWINWEADTVTATSIILNLGSSTITCNYWYGKYTSISNVTLNAGTSTIVVNEEFQGDGLTYNNVTFNDDANMRGSNTFADLVIAAGKTVTLETGTTTIANNIKSGTGSSQAMVSCSTGTITFKNATITDIKALGGAIFAIDNCVDGGGNYGIAGIFNSLKSGLNDDVTDAFIMNDKFYFLDGTGYYVYDGTNVAAVTGYIPTVLIGKAPAGTGGTADEEFNLLSDSWKESFSGTAGDMDYVLTFPCDSITEVKVGGVALAADAYELQADKVTVKFDSAPGEGTDNIVITATEDGLMDTTAITKCRFHSIYGGLNDTRVFLSGNADYKNATFHSGLNDPTYFPESGLVYHGSDAEAVKGMARVADYHLTFKERQIYYTDVDLSTTTVLFPTKPMNDEYGCTSWRTVKPAQGGALALSYDGVIWTVPSSVRGQLNTVIISKEINKGVGEVDGILEETRTSLESAWAEVFENKYYLHVNDKCWILDLNYSSLSEGVACWYPYDGLYKDATCMVEGQDGYLYMGDELGVVYRNNTSYSDAGVAIDAWWTSPMIFGDVTRYKKFLYLNCSFGSEASATQNIYVYTEEDLSEDSEAIVDANAFSFDDIDFDNWTFGSHPYSLPVTIWFKTKGWFVYWKWRNNQLNQGMTIHSQVLFYTNGKKVK